MKKSIVIITLHECGWSPSEIVILLKPLGIDHLFVFCMVKWYSKTGDTVDKLREGHRHSVHMPNVIHAVREYVRWNPLHKQKRMTVEMSVSAQSMSCILHDNLKLSAYKHGISHTLTPKLKEIFWIHCAALPQWFKRQNYWNIIAF